MMSDSDRARSALLILDAGCDRSTWVRLGMAFKAAGGNIDTWIDWCATGVNYGGEREARMVWRSVRAGGGISAATLYGMARDAGWVDGAPCVPLSARERRGEPKPDRKFSETLDPRWLRYWQSLGPVRDAGRAYLEARRCALPPADGDLRFDPAARHPCGHTGACLVALATDVGTNAPITLHRTWINPDGSKADVEPPRLLLGGHRKAGGVLRLWPNEAVTHGLAIAEGVETALSLAQVYQPAWALIDAGNLMKFPVLPGVESLLIAADHDAAGRRAAAECAERWARADLEVTLVEAFDGP